MPSRPNLIPEAKELVRISTAWEALGLPGEPRRSCRSPFRDDHSPSFSVYDEGRKWKDHATGDGGDVLDFIKAAAGWPDREAIEWLLSRAGLADRQLECAPRDKRDKCDKSSSPPVTMRQSSDPETSVDRGLSSLSRLSPPDGFDWQSCCAAFNGKHTAALAAWRAYPEPLIAFLHDRGFLGIHANRLAIPVYQKDRVIGAQLFKRGERPRYTRGTPALPVVLGNLATASEVWVSESQWDSFALLAGLGPMDETLAHTAFIATRGASNGGKVAGLIPVGTKVVVAPQNDLDSSRDQSGKTPAEKWTAAVMRHLSQNPVTILITPTAHEDPNAWLQAVGLEAFNRELDDVRTTLGQSSVEDVEEDYTDASDPFPHEALPAVLLDMAWEIARVNRVPVGLPASCILGTVSAALGQGLILNTVAGKQTRANLFFLLAAESGSGKSETHRAAAHPIIDIQATLVEAWRTHIWPQAKAEVRLLTKEVEALEKQAASASQDERCELIENLARKEADLDRARHRASPPAFIADDVTTPKLARMLGDNGETLFSTSADAANVLQNIQGKHNSGKADETLYLKAFSGDYYRQDRQGDGGCTLELQSPCLAALWLTQPAKLEEILANRSMADGGMLPRILLCEFECEPLALTEQDGIDPTVSNYYRVLLQKLFSRFRFDVGNFDEQGERHLTFELPEPSVVDPDPKAREMLIQYAKTTVRRRIEELRDVNIFATRWPELAWKLALVLHAAQHGAEAAVHDLGADTVRSAIRLMEWYSRRSLDGLAYGRTAATRKVHQQVLEIMEDHPNGLKLRDLSRSGITKPRHRAEPAEKLLKEMETAGLVRSERRETGSPGRFAVVWLPGRSSTKT